MRRIAAWVLSEVGILPLLTGLSFLVATLSFRAVILGRVQGVDSLSMTLIVILPMIAGWFAARELISLRRAFMSGCLTGRDNLVRQLDAPVLWNSSMKTLIDLGYVRYIEAGPGTVLRGLMKAQGRDAQVFSVEKPADIVTLNG